jgi:ribosome maturation factor RimP
MHGSSRQGSARPASRGSTPAAAGPKDRAASPKDRTAARPKGSAPAAAGPKDSAARPRGSAPAAAGPADAEQLTRLLQPVVTAAGMDLENIRITATGRRRLLRVTVDADNGVSLDDITLISRTLSAELDAIGAMGETPYTLEVSSPGADRPLTEPRHWRRAAGRLVRAPLRTRSQSATETAGHARTAGPARTRTVEGRVLAATEDAVTLDVAGERREFGYAELGPGKILLEFGHFGEHADRGETDGH